MRLGFEVKFTEAPKATPSMRSARKDLQLDHLWVIYPGAQTFPMDAGITAVPVTGLGVAAQRLKNLQQPS